MYVAIILRSKRPFFFCSSLFSAVLLYHLSYTYVHDMMILLCCCWCVRSLSFSIEDYESDTTAAVVTEVYTFGGTFFIWRLFSLAWSLAQPVLCRFDSNSSSSIYDIRSRCRLVIILVHCCCCKLYFCTAVTAVCCLRVPRLLYWSSTKGLAKPLSFLLIDRQIYSLLCMCCIYDMRMYVTTLCDMIWYYVTHDDDDGDSPPPAVLMLYRCIVHRSRLYLSLVCFLSSQHAHDSHHMYSWYIYVCTCIQTTAVVAAVVFDVTLWHVILLRGYSIGSRFFKTEGYTRGEVIYLYQVFKQFTGTTK